MKLSQRTIHAGLIISTALSAVAASSRFIVSQCTCDDNSIARSLDVNFIQKNGKEAGVSVDFFCNGHDNPRDCEAWPLIGQCGDTGFCGVGKLCYNEEVFKSDTFGVNGVTYKKNSYYNVESNIHGSALCTSLCLNYGKSTCYGGGKSCADDGGSWSYTITDFPEPKNC